MNRAIQKVQCSIRNQIILVRRLGRMNIAAMMLMLTILFVGCLPRLQSKRRASTRLSRVRNQCANNSFFQTRWRARPSLTSTRTRLNWNNVSSDCLIPSVLLLEYPTWRSGYSSKRMMLPRRASGNCCVMPVKPSNPRLKSDGENARPLGSLIRHGLAA